jgi:hypothetical protein
MDKPNKYFDIGLLVAFLIWLVLAVYRHFADDYVLYLNNILALILLATGILIKGLKSKYSNYVLIALLLLATFNIINFSAEVFTFNMGYTSSTNNGLLSVVYPGINPIVLLLLIIYCIVNRRFIKKLINGSDKNPFLDV